MRLQCYQYVITRIGATDTITFYEYARATDLDLASVMLAISTGVTTNTKTLSLAIPILPVKIQLRDFLKLVWIHIHLLYKTTLFPLVQMKISLVQDNQSNKMPLPWHMCTMIVSELFGVSDVVLRSLLCRCSFSAPGAQWVNILATGVRLQQPSKL